MLTLDYKEYSKSIRKAVAESVVLLKNDGETLPIKQNETVAIFGRAQIDTYYCGTGSGGMVNIPYLVNIVDGLKQKRDIDESLHELYKAFISENLFDKGKGWAQEPFSQKELSLSEQTVETAAQHNDVAIFVVGRSAGEDRDSETLGGSYYLSDIEKQNLKYITKHFEKVVVMLNTGGVVDMSFVEEFNPSAVLYAWHGGIESGNGYADVLCGDVGACGCMPDTVAKTVDLYPATQNFSGEKENIYAEDIFVGYRYFETFAKQDVMYPFGFGLSYTSFQIDNIIYNNKDNEFTFKFNVKNTGNSKGKKTVQLYVSQPFGKLGKPSRVLVGFAKTKELKPNETQQLTIVTSTKHMSSFDEKISAFVLEEGEYSFFLGFDVRSAEKIAHFNIAKLEVLEKCCPALMPIKPFKVLSALQKDGEIIKSYSDVLTRTYDLNDRIKTESEKATEKTNIGYTFDDVKSGKIDVKSFVKDLSDKELIELSRGEGMCSPKVTAGTAGSYGGVSTSLFEKRKLPIACCSDGPSGIRMDCGTMAFSVPNATAIASTFNTDIVCELFDFMSKELAYHKIDTLLGPGINIHRHPLCGRNFEYYSEDPFLSGTMAIAQIKTMKNHNITATIKHFVANNQEKARNTVDSVVSARALREIYLKSFEMAVKESGATCIMTAYNPINGTQAASNFDLNTTILRNDWGFKGIVMTDWWATMNKENGEASVKYTADMITAQNDLFMVCVSSELNSGGDNSDEKFALGELSRHSLARNAVNIISSIVNYNCSKGHLDVEILNEPENLISPRNDLGVINVENAVSLDTKKIITTKGVINSAILNQKVKGVYNFTVDMFADSPELAQPPLTIRINGKIVKTLSLKGGKSGVFNFEIDMLATTNTHLELFFGESGMVINEFTIKRLNSV